MFALAQVRHDFKQVKYYDSIRLICTSDCPVWHGKACTSQEEGHVENCSMCCPQDPVQQWLFDVCPNLEEIFEGNLNLQHACRLFKCFEISSGVSTMEKN